MIKTIQNLTFFKVGWIACVLFAASGRPMLASLSVAAVVLVHLARVTNPAKESLLLAAAAVMGLSWESLMVAMGVISYPGSETGALFAPLWIVAMWVLFATTINHGFRWAKRHWAYPAVLGAVGGPMAFSAGVGMGAAEFSNTFVALSVIGIGWAVLLPLLCLVADTIIDSTVLENESRARAPQRVKGLLTALGGVSRDV